MRWLACIAAAGGLVAAPAWAEVRIRFVDPAAYTDAGLYAPGPVGPDAPVLAAMRQVFERAGRRLPPGQDLAVEVLDIDLAGYFPPGQMPPYTRLLLPTTWPAIRLRYTLTQDGRVIGRGEETLTDQIYQRRAGAVRSTAPLRFEEPMVIDWFAVRFGAAPRISVP